MAKTKTENKKIIPISKEEFAKYRFNRFPHYGHAARDSVMPLVMAEVNSAMMEIPLAFMKSKDEYALYGIASLVSGINMLITGEGRFRTNYIPACYRAYPFLFATTEAGERVLCIDNESGLLVKEGNEGESFFDEKGEPTPTLSSIMQLLGSVSDSLPFTKKALETLDKFDLIVEWKPKFNVVGREQELQGIYGVDDEKLFKLGGDDLVQLRDSGALSLAFAQVFSRQHFRAIEQLTRLVVAQSQTQNNSLVNQKGDLDIEFLNKQDNTISFGAK